MQDGFQELILMREPGDLAAAELATAEHSLRY